MHLNAEVVFASTPGPALLLHGGAWNIPEKEWDDHEAGMSEALDEGISMLDKGYSALEISAQVVASMESYGAFDAGRGAVLNKEGYVELDAGIMDGWTRRWGAVAGVRTFLNPVHIARSIALEGNGEFCFLASPHAERHALRSGLEPLDPEALICSRERKRYEELRAADNTYHTSHPFLPGGLRAPRGTVGCVVRDSNGHLAAATSTGGTPYRLPGRIGDSPLPGCGYFANRVAAASATGWGEAIAACVLCRETVSLVEHGLSAVEAVSQSLKTMYDTVRNAEGVGATGGLILVESQGDAAWGFTTPCMARAGWGDTGLRLVTVW